MLLRQDLSAVPGTYYYSIELQANGGYSTVLESYFQITGSCVLDQISLKSSVLDKAFTMVDSVPRVILDLELPTDDLFFDLAQVFENSLGSECPF